MYANTVRCLKKIPSTRDVVLLASFRHYRRVYIMYTIASCYVSGTSALHSRLLLRLVYKFSKPERSNSRDEKSVEIIVEHVQYAPIIKSSSAPSIRMEKEL